MKFIKSTFIAIGLAFMVGCAGVASDVYSNPSAQVAPMKPKVIFVPSDVEISIRNAGGDLELNAEMSDGVSEAYNAAAMNLMFERGVQFIPYGTRGLKDEHVDVVREANTIMDSIQLSQSANGGIGSDRNFSLSEAARREFAEYGADYVTFSVLRAATASAGRQTVAVIAAIGGVPVNTSDAQFRVAVFDLRDGQCIWANFDPMALPDGDWVDADEEDWEEIIDHMYSGFTL
jgi:hypothetical protein